MLRERKNGMDELNWRHSLRKCGETCRHRNKINSTIAAPIDLALIMHAYKTFPLARTDPDSSHKAPHRCSTQHQRWRGEPPIASRRTDDIGEQDGGAVVLPQ